MTTRSIILVRGARVSGAGRCDSADRHIPARRPRRMRPPPVLIPPGTTIGQAVKRMADDAISSAVVVDGSGRPKGIITEQDVVRRISRRPCNRAEPAASTTCRHWSMRAAYFST
ncbi:MAG: CBS domain-containing protein [Rhodoplanes sp.]